MINCCERDEEFFSQFYLNFWLILRQSQHNEKNLLLDLLLSKFKINKNGLLDFEFFFKFKATVNFQNSIYFARKSRSISLAD